MDFIEAQTCDGTGTLRLSRGKVNALNQAVVDQLRRVLKDCESDPEITAIILTGTGSFLSFGFDVPEFLSASKRQFIDYLMSFTDLYTYIFQYPKPVIAALNGHTIAGGCVLALACDYRVMVTGKAKISQMRLALVMAERTITVGSVSKEYRMIGWRVGWIVAPPKIINDIGLVTISNVVCPVGIAQKGATIALRLPDSDIASATEEWQRRRDVIVEELEGFPIVKPQGGWSLLMDASQFRLTGAEFSRRLLDNGQVVATAITGWGSNRSDSFIRFVFSNESLERLKVLRGRIEAAIG